MKIYLASNYSTWPEMQTHAQKLVALGHEVTSEWITGTHQQDDHRDYAEIDLRDIDAADALILFTEAPPNSRTRGGKHVEFGYALAKGKRLFLVGRALNVFHHLPGVVQRLTFDDLLYVLPSRVTMAEVVQALGYCVRAAGHEGPCNGLPRGNCPQRPLPENGPASAQLAPAGGNAASRPAGSSAEDSILLLGEKP